ncbi:MAG: phenylalanine--tRNA ligase subunit alpha, partial [bacterium]
MQEQINTLRSQALSELQTLKNPEQLPEWFRAYLGRKGNLTELLKGLGNLRAEERPLVGKAVNEVKAELQEAFEARQEELRQARLQQEIATDAIDVTLPGRPVHSGHLHLTKQVLRK